MLSASAAKHCLLLICSSEMKLVRLFRGDQRRCLSIA